MENTFEKWADEVGLVGFGFPTGLSDEEIEIIKKAVQEAYARGRRDRDEELIKLFEDEWLGDDYHGDSIETIIRNNAAQEEETLSSEG